MIEGCRRYRNYCDRLRLSSTEYVMQPRRFFGPSQHFELDWIIKGSRIAAQEARSQATMQRLRAQEQHALEPLEAKTQLAAIRMALK